MHEELLGFVVEEVTTKWALDGSQGLNWECWVSKSSAGTFGFFMVVPGKKLPDLTLGVRDFPGRLGTQVHPGPPYTRFPANLKGCVNHICTLELCFTSGLLNCHSDVGDGLRKVFGQSLD